MRENVGDGNEMSSDAAVTCIADDSESRGGVRMKLFISIFRRLVSLPKWRLSFGPKRRKINARTKF